MLKDGKFGLDSVKEKAIHIIHFFELQLGLVLSLYLLLQSLEFIIDFPIFCLQLNLISFLFDQLQLLKVGQFLV